MGSQGTCKCPHDCFLLASKPYRRGFKAFIPRWVKTAMETFYGKAVDANLQSIYFIEYPCDNILCPLTSLPFSNLAFNHIGEPK